MFKNKAIKITVDKKNDETDAYYQEYRMDQNREAMKETAENLGKLVLGCVALRVGGQIAIALIENK